MVAGRQGIKYIYSITVCPRGKDAASIGHHCANTNVSVHCPYDMKVLPLLTFLFCLSCDMGQRKFISKNEWFEMTYPSHWTDFEEEGGTYMFMDNDDWKGNLRITAMRLETGDRDSKEKYLKKHLNDELLENDGATKIRLGDKDAVHYSKDVVQDGDTLEIHYWATGDKTTLLICSFTMDKDMVDNKEVKKEFDHATATLASIKVRDEGNER